MGYLSNQRYDAVPARSAASVTPSDATTLFTSTKGVWVGGAGNLAVTMHDGTSVTLVGVVAGSLLPVSVTQILATGTTATDIVVFY